MAKSLEEIQKEFESTKKANSPWLSIESGESVNIVRLRSMKAESKTNDTTGVTSAVMSIEVDVETEEGLKVKKWSTGSSKLVQSLVDNGIDVGSSFTVTKRGESFGTTYEITNVVNKPKAETVA